MRELKNGWHQSVSELPGRVYLCNEKVGVFVYVGVFV